MEYVAPAGMPAVTAPADSLVNRLNELWYVPPGSASETGQVVAAADCDSLGGIRDVSVIAPSPAAALNAAALNALDRLKTAPPALAGFPPNRRRLIVTFYYNAASTPGPVPPPPGWPPPGALRPGPGVSPQRVVRDVRPIYTRLARQARIQGGVVVESVVRRDGSVGDAVVVRSLDRTFGLDQEALNAIKQWRFVPGTRSGGPVDVVVTVELVFALE